MVDSAEMRRFVADHPGTPLGRGYPSGTTLRLDGESHRMAWQRILRDDPCAYCGGPGGTVDHVEPQDPLRSCRGLGGKYAWTNLSGCCSNCNEKKRNRDLMRFLSLRAADRRVILRKVPELQGEAAAA